MKRCKKPQGIRSPGQTVRLSMSVAARFKNNRNELSKTEGKVSWFYARCFKNAGFSRMRI